jgi:VCBS repeat-containing protein
VIRPPRRLIGTIFTCLLFVSATAWAQAPIAIVAREGQSQPGYAGQAYRTPLRAGVYDAAGMPVSGAAVTFAVPATGPSGSFDGSPTLTVVTDNTGLTPPVTVTANMIAGGYTVTASVAGVAAPARFILKTMTGGGNAIPHGAKTSANSYYQPHQYGYGHTISDPRCSWMPMCSSTNWSTSFINGDFNNDGFSDLVAYNHGHKEVSFRWGSSSGYFSGPVNSVVPTPNSDMWDIAAGDFNQDGKLDVVLPTGTTSLRIMYGNGAGAFAAGPLVPVAATGIAAWVATADLNRDGFLDIVTSGGEVLLGTGPGTFVKLGAGGGGSSEVVIADIDRDGHLDVVFGASYGNAITLARGKGDGTFFASEHYTIGREPNRIAVGDFNGDGLPDIAAAIQPNNGSTFHSGMGAILNTGGAPGARFAAPKQFLGRASSYRGGIATGDLNRDGFDDVIYSADSFDVNYGPQPESYWLMSVGDGTFVNIGQAMNVMQPNEVIIEDFNLDGMPDVAMNGYGGGAPYLGSGITVFHNVGRSTASLLAYYGTPQSIPITKAGQFNVSVRDSGNNKIPYARITVNAPTSGPSLSIGGKTTVSHLANLNGDFGWLPTANDQLGPYTVTVTSPMLGGVNAVAEYFITNVPAPPNAGNDGPYTTLEDSPLAVSAPGLLANDSDPSGTAIIAQVVTQGSKGVVIVDPDGGFLYTPNANQNGTDTFTYRAWNGASGTNATVTVIITAVADAPTVVNRTYSVNEDAALTIAAAGVLTGATDPEGGAFTAAVVSTTSNGTLTLAANGGFTYVPAPNFNGSDSFTFTARDTNGNTSAPGTITIAVAAVYDPPVAVTDTYTTNEDTALTIGAPGLLANDTVNAGAQAALAIAPAHGTVAVTADGSFVYTPESNYNGPDGFTYSIVEGEGSVTGSVTIVVNAVDDAPRAGDDTAGTITGAPVGGNLFVNDTDDDGDGFGAELVSPPSYGSVSVALHGFFSYTPALNFAGTDTFTYQVRNSGGTSAPATVTITIAAAPTVTTLGVSAPAVAFGEPVTFIVTIGVVAPGSGLPGGTITFMNGAVAIGTAPLSGAGASLTTSALAPGTYAVSAIYSGNVAFTGSGSPATPLTVTANTPAGADVVATPVDDETGASPITLEFDQVTTPGTTTLEITPTGPPPAAGFKFGQPPTYYNLETTAVFSGVVTVCFSYDETSVGNESKLKLFHFEDGHWTNITTGVDTVNNKVCGMTTHLSPFAIGEPIDDAAPSIDVAAWPREIGPPNGKLVAVTISGSIADDESGVASASFSVADEYGLVQPSGAVIIDTLGRYSVTVMLPASRNGNDQDGRTFTITVRAVDALGNGGHAVTTAVVVHDQGKKKG